MEITLSKIKMEFEMDNIALGVFGHLPFEADSFNPFAAESQSHDALSNINVEHRRKVASQLLEVLEGSENLQDEPYCGWLEEPMDLEVFEQSLVGTTAPLDDEDSVYISAPPSPSASLPPTPLQPTSPQDLYNSPDDLPVLKFEEHVSVFPAENVELLESLELLLTQIQTEEAIASLPIEHEPKEDDSDAATALLDSLITSDVEESQVLDELAEFSLALMSSEQVENTIPANSIRATSSESDDQEWMPPNSRGAQAGRSHPIQRKPRSPRKKSLKVEDRRLRKKEQNKTAATRYRIKKKAELEILLDEEAHLEERNRQLQTRHDELASEIRYLKKLMREVFAARSGKRR